MIPLRVTADDSLHGDSSFQDALTILIQSPVKGQHYKDVYEWKNTGVSIAYEYNPENNYLQISTTAYHSPIIFLVRGVSMPKTIHNKVRIKLGHNTRQASGGYLEAVQVPAGVSCGSVLAKQRQGWCAGNKQPNELVIRIDDTSSGAFLHLQGIQSL